MGLKQVMVVPWTTSLGDEKRIPGFIYLFFNFYFGVREETLPHPERTPKLALPGLFCRSGEGKERLCSCSVRGGGSDMGLPCTVL